MLPPLAQEQVEAAEAQFGVELPEDYRSFLVEVGAGGAGPGYGLFALLEVDGRWQWDAKFDDARDTSRLVAPFDPNCLDARLAELEAAEPPPTSEAYLLWLARWEDAYFHPSRTAGAAALAHFGCGALWLLVVSGPHRGSIWFDDRPSDGGLEPVTGGDGTRQTFRQWYLEWLRGAEKQAGLAEMPLDRPFLD